MPVNRSKSPLAAKLGAAGAKAHEAHKADPVKMGGGGDLPGGIVGGVAQLTKCSFGEFEKGDNKGEPYFMAMGVVVEPTDHAGKHTKVGPIALCATKSKAGKEKSFEDNYATMLNELKKLGANVEEVGVDDLETVAAALVEEAPHFKFNTDQGQVTPEYPTPRVWENWRGRCDYNGEVTSGVEDNSGGVDSVETADEDVPFGDDLDMMADAAGKKDKKGNPTEEAKEAQKAIAKRADKAGVGEESGNADTWEEAIEIVRTAEKGDDSQTDETTEEKTEESADERPDPVKGEIYFYKSPRGQNEKPKDFNSRKAVECDVVSVDKKKRTAVLKDLHTQKNLKNPVSWDDLRDEQ